MAMRDIPGQTGKSSQQGKGRIGKVPGWAQAYLQSQLGKDQGKGPGLKCSSRAKGQRPPVRHFTALLHRAFSHTSWIQAQNVMVSLHSQA